MGLGWDDRGLIGDHHNLLSHSSLDMDCVWFLGVFQFLVGAALVLVAD